MRTSTVVVIGILGLAGTPLALHLVGGSTPAATSWIKKLHGGSGGSGVREVLRPAQDKTPAPKVAATLAGKWTVTVDNAQGQLVLTMVLKQDGRKLTGTLTNPHGEGTLPIGGELVDGALTLAADATTDHDEMHLAFKGAVKDDGSLAGKMTSAMGESAWAAVRTKEK